MSKIYLIVSIVFTLFANLIFANGTDGLIDSTFGNGGKVTTAVGPGSSEVWSMAIQTDWSVVVGGFAYNGSDSDFALVRYTPGGELDPTFGSNGIVTTDIGNGHDVIYSIALQPDGKIVAGGISWNGTDYDFAVARYDTYGVLDPTFGNNGIVTTAIGPGNDKGVSLKMQNGWSIVVGGIAHNGSDNDFAVVRYDTNGNLDSTFGVHGKVVTPIGAANDMAFSIDVQQFDWSVVVGGVAYNGTDYDFALVRYSPNGMLDSTFGTNGKVVTDISNRKDFVWSVLVTPGKQILMGGYSTNLLNNKDFTLVQYKKDGSLDGDFGVGGIATISPLGTGNEEIYSLALQTDGKIIAGGTADSLGVENYALARYTSDGLLDPTFGAMGHVTTLMSEGNSEIYSVALQPDGKIVAAGYSSDSSKATFSMARFVSGLSLGVIDFSASDNSVFIYPNPIAQDAMLEYTLNKEEVVSISLIDMQGKTVKVFAENQKQEAGDHTQPIILPLGLAPGNYAILISSPKGKMSIQIVK